MLHHVSVGVSDVERAAKFYDAVLGALGYQRIMEFLPYAVAYGEASPSFWIQLPHDRGEPSVGNGAHIGFSARTKDAVEEFFRIALDEGGEDNGAPGPRPDYGPDYYGAFVIDLDGNKIEATLHPEAKPARRTAGRRTKAKPAAKKVAKAARKSARKPARRSAKRPAKSARRKARRR